MIRGHRGRHRLAWWVLAVGLPVLLWVAIRARVARPVTEEPVGGVPGFSEGGAAEGSK